jgi:hypothetical protein
MTNPEPAVTPIVTTPTITVETITPEIAKKYLAENMGNRTMRSRVVDIYALDMTTGNWKFLGDPIRFARNGQLLDGQHRLAAIVQSKTTQQMVVVRDLFMSSQLNMDRGVKRNFADYLKFLGEVNVHMYSAIIGAVTRWEENQSLRSNNISHAEMEKTYHKYPELKDAISVVQRANNAVRCGYVAGGMVWWRLNQIDSEECSQFFERLISQEDHHQGDPIFALRRVLLSNSSAGRVRSLPAQNVAALMIKAWNKWRDGERVEVLMWRGGGSNPEAFPEPK